jgi:hypothetical protein
MSINRHISCSLLSFFTRNSKDFALLTATREIRGLKDIVHLGFMGCLPYEACLIIPLQTLLMECKSLPTTQTQVLQWWNKNMHIIMRSEHQLWLLKYTISEIHTPPPFWDNHSWHYLKNNYTHLLDQKKKSWYFSTTLAHKNEHKSQSKAIITAAHLN